MPLIAAQTLGLDPGLGPDEGHTPNNILKAAEDMASAPSTSRATPAPRPAPKGPISVGEGMPLPRMAGIPPADLMHWVHSQQRRLSQQVGMTSHV